MKNPWIQSARLRTLPLAISGILLGIVLSKMHHHQHLGISVLAILTATLLQILSNYANDYGDFQKGTDSKAGRQDRMLTTGSISESSMKKALYFLGALTFVLGTIMIVWSYQLHLISSNGLGYFMAIGIVAIFSAIAYTVGKNAYGYLGLGDLFVFVFFGLVPVIGTAILLGCELNSSFGFAAAGMGFLSTAVLNTNNYRDIESDKESHKNTFPTRIGARWTLFYHRLLLLFGFLGIFIAMVNHVEHLLNASAVNSKNSLWDFNNSQNYLLVMMIFGVFSPVAILLSQHFSDLKRLKPGDRENINPQLKKLSLSTLLFVVLFGVLGMFVDGWFYGA